MGRVFTRLSIALGAMIVASGVLAGGIAAAEPAATQVAADLEGRPMAVSEIPNWYCHDLDFPLIHCYRSAAKLEHSLAAKRSELAANGAVTAAAATYVIIYRDATLQGPYFPISQPYDDLGSIGWNDMISSFKPVNGLGGHFATDARNEGRLYPFCCNSPVYYVGDTWNDQFSSVYP